MYGALQDDACLSQLRQIKVDVIANRPGQVLRNYLIDTMTADSSPSNKYLLKVSLTEHRNKLGLRRDETSSFEELVITGTLKLENIETGKTEFTDTVSQVASFPLGSNSRSESYSADVAEEGARDKALKIMADDINIHLASYLLSKK